MTRGGLQRAMQPRDGHRLHAHGEPVARTNGLNWPHGQLPAGTKHYCGDGLRHAKAGRSLPGVCQLPKVIGAGAVLGAV